MTGTTGPLFGALMSGVVLLFGWYLASQGSGSITYLGWIFVGVGVIGVIVNLLLSRRTNRG